MSYDAHSASHIPSNHPQLPDQPQPSCHRHNRVVQNPSDGPGISRTTTAGYKTVQNPSTGFRTMPQPRGTKPIGQDQDHSMPQSHGRAIPSHRRTASERFDLLLHNHAGAAEPLKIKAPPHRHVYWTIRRPSSSDDGRPRSDAMAAAATTQRHAAARNQQRNRGDHRRHHHSSTGVRRFLAVRPTRGRGLLSARRLLPIRRLL